MKNVKRNLDNLTSLWKQVGVLAGSYEELEHYCISQVPNSQWPNRIWIKDAVNNNLLREIRQYAKQFGPLTLSYWSDFENRNLSLFQQNQFEIKSEQIGMHLDIVSKFDHPERLELVRISTFEQADIWEKLYPQSFGYIISGKTVMRTNGKVEYYLIYLGLQVIGTAILYETDNTIGIHAMGIIPAYRKQGYAQEVVLRLLNSALDRAKTHVTLQASALGNSIYKKIGFMEDFLMTNYVIV